MMIYLLPFVTALILAAILTPLTIVLAKKLNIIDQPNLNERKIHTRPVPQLGGLAIFIAFSATTLIFWYFGLITNIRVTEISIIFILTASLVLSFGGYLDDKYRLKPSQQIIFPTIAACLTIVAGIKISSITNPVGGVINIAIFVSIPLTFLWLMGMMYTTKFLDGLDGLTTGVTVIGAIIIFIVSLFWDIPQSGTSVLSIILVGTCLGFLVYNWHPAKIFLGEGGSVLCGYLLGVLAVISGSKIATTLLVVGIPVLDTLWVILRRILWEKKLPFIADRKHLHFRLLDIGFSHQQAVLFLYFISLLFGTLSIFLKTRGKIVALLLLVVVMFFIAIYIVLIYKNKRRLGIETKTPKV